MLTATNFLVGPSLTSFIASNLALMQPTLVTIPGGTFMMGAGSRFGAQQEMVSKFQMGRTPVTNDEYTRYLDLLGERRCALLGTNFGTKMLSVIGLGTDEKGVKSAFREVVLKAQDILVAGGLGVLGDAVTRLLDELHVVYIQTREYIHDAKLDGPRQPVVNVGWEEAFVYASLHGGRLPTEKEWEYAARVVEGKEGLRDYATPSGRLTRAEAHYAADRTANVDDPIYPALENGLRHMTGNVWEWMQGVADTLPIPKREYDPLGLYMPHAMSLRGGAWDETDPENLLASHKYGAIPEGSSSIIGFRVVAPAEPAR